MPATIDLPKAFSVRDDHEFYPIQHLVARLNPDLMVSHVATGVHVEGGCTVFWGLVHLKDEPLTEQQVKTALAEAGFDVAHNGSIQFSA